MFHGTYVVQSGDTLTKIAAKLGMSIDDILDNNPEITDPNKISVDQEISYPDSMVKVMNVQPSAPQTSGPRTSGTSVPMTASKAKFDLMKLVQDPKMLAIGAVVIIGAAVILKPKKR